MSRVRRFVQKPVTAFQDTPVTYLVTLAIAGMTFWLGVVLLTVTIHLPPERRAGYAGPVSLMPLQGWGAWFVVAGLLGVARLFAHDARRVSLALHLVMMMSLMAWALAFDFGGPPTTGQPAYTFLAIACFLSPYFPAMIERRYGPRPPNSPHRF